MNKKRVNWIMSKKGKETRTLVDPQSEGKNVPTSRRSKRKLTFEGASGQRPRFFVKRGKGGGSEEEKGELRRLDDSSLVKLINHAVIRLQQLDKQLEAAQQQIDFLRAYKFDSTVYNNLKHLSESSYS
jgi:hypothetical protein